MWDVEARSFASQSACRQAGVPSITSKQPCKMSPSLLSVSRGKTGSSMFDEEMRPKWQLHFQFRWRDTCCCYQRWTYKLARVSKSKSVRQSSHLGCLICTKLLAAGLLNSNSCCRWFSRWSKCDFIHFQRQHSADNVVRSHRKNTIFKPISRLEQLA